jgi:enterochelin esterase-like enzyme
MRKLISLVVVAVVAAGLASVQPTSLSAAEPDSSGSGEEVAFITRNAAKLPKLDAIMVGVLSGEGYDVVLVDDDDIDGTTAFDSATIGVISSSVLPRKIPSWLATSDLPLLNFTSDLPLVNFEGYGNSPTTSTTVIEEPPAEEPTTSTTVIEEPPAEEPTTSTTVIEEPPAEEPTNTTTVIEEPPAEEPTNKNSILMYEANAGHPLTAGLTGYQDVNKASQATHNSGEVGGDAIVIATTTGREKQAIYYAYEYAYEAGTELANGDTAPARRVAYFSRYRGPETLSLVDEQLIVAAVDWLAAEPAASAYADDIIDLRGDWQFEVYRKYSHMFQYFYYPIGLPVVTWEDIVAAELPTAEKFAAWETVAVPSPDYSTGGLLQMVRPGSGEVQDDRTQLTEFDMFPKWSEAWFARTVEIPEGFLDGTDDVTLLLGIIDDLDVVYVNGTPIGAKGFKTSDGVVAPPENVPATGGFDADGEFQFETSYWEVPREYEFDASLLHEGTNELTVRLYNNNSFGGFYDRQMALVATRDAVRYLKDMPTEQLPISTAYESVVDAQVAAIESEDLVAYGATLDDRFVENELDKSERIAAMQKIFDEYDGLQVEDVDGGFYWYQGAPVYSAERVITGVKNVQPVVVQSNDQHLQYFVSHAGVVRERGNFSHTYAVDYVSELGGMNGATLRYSIYLPPSYYSGPDRDFPVVYLLHGINSTGDSFVNVDQIEQRMNEWIEDGSITEMIVIMPNSGKSSGYEDRPGGPNDSQGPWASHIYVDILDQIETNYRTIPDAGFRGLTGISMGGGGVFKIGLDHTDIYTSFASHMGAIPDLSAYEEALLSGILPSLDFYIDHGLQDEMVNPVVSELAAEYLESIGANLEFELRDGGHNSAFYMAGMPNSMAMHSAHFISNGLDNP